MEETAMRVTPTGYGSVIGRDRPGRKPRRCVLVLCLVIPAIAVTWTCGSIGARPYLVPLPDARIDSVPAEPDVIIATLQNLVVGEGLTIRVSSPAEGYLETDWYDTVMQAPGGGSSLDPRRAVRFRFFADRLGDESTRLASEAVMRRVVDPSLEERQNEIMAPPGHPGAELLVRVLSAMRASLASSSP
jgi:hypothetical protein